MGMKPPASSLFQKVQAQQAQAAVQQRQSQAASAIQGAQTIQTLSKITAPQDPKKMPTLSRGGFFGVSSGTERGKLLS